MTTQIILGWTLEQSSDWSATLQNIFYSGATYFNRFTGFGVTVHAHGPQQFTLPSCMCVTVKELIQNWSNCLSFMQPFATLWHL